MCSKFNVMSVRPYEIASRKKKKERKKLKILKVYIPTNENVTIGFISHHLLICVIIISCVVLKSQ